MDKRTQQRSPNIEQFHHPTGSQQRGRQHRLARPLFNPTIGAVSLALWRKEDDTDHGHNADGTNTKPARLGFPTAKSERTQ